MLLSLNEHLGLCSRSWCMPSITATTTLCWWLLRHMYCCVILSVVADMLIELTQYLPLCLPPWHLLYLINTVCSYCFMFRSNNVCNWPYVQLLIWTNLALIVCLCIVYMSLLHIYRYGRLSLCSSICASLNICFMNVCMYVCPVLTSRYEKGRSPIHLYQHYRNHYCYISSSSLRIFI